MLGCSICNSDSPACMHRRTVSGMSWGIAALAHLFGYCSNHRGNSCRVSCYQYVQSSPKSLGCHLGQSGQAHSWCLARSPGILRLVAVAHPASRAHIDPAISLEAAGQLPPLRHCLTLVPGLSCQLVTKSGQLTELLPAYEPLQALFAASRGLTVRVYADSGTS